MKTYPVSCQFAPALRLEEELDDIAAEAPGDERRYVHLNAARYYLRSIMSTCPVNWANLTLGVTNYGSLMDQIWNWHLSSGDPVRLVTFNYDVLLERGCEMSIPGLGFGTVDTYAARDDLRIYRPHGCVAWQRVMQNGVGELDEVSERGVIRLGKQLRPTDEFVAADGINTQENRVLVPAIAIPLQNKTVFELPESHMARLLTDSAEVDRLLIIGWRATDIPFLTRWKSALTGRPAVQIVSGSDSGCTETLENLRGGIDLRGQPELHGAGFSSFVQSRGVLRLLHDQF
ncbi:MAG TPA: hypothetical protein VLI88_07320 [Patescibacteria group bacterium]|nr:hypothetical protein [Patescibacteria group bacterium]